MQIAFVEVQNFRKLKSVRIDLSDKTTLLVGANNSGKTSAMLALREFLLAPRRGFSTNDFTLSNWSVINAIGLGWAAAGNPPATPQWDAVLPALDLWLKVEPSEVHYVRALIPSLSWQGGRLGVRIRFEPKSSDELRKAFVTALSAADRVRAAAGNTNTLTVWPTDLKGFLDRKLRDLFVVRFYSLDPGKCVAPKDGIAKPQALPLESEPIDGDPLEGLIRVDEISAQRGFTDSAAANSDVHESRERRLLTDQLRTYYAKHLDISDSPDAADFDALKAIENAQTIFDDRLAAGFSSALRELSELNYPGVTDARLTIATNVRPADGLNHSGAVHYDVAPVGGSGAKLRLPERYNGLGYQNLISMVFRLMSFRDGWMRVGKAGGNSTEIAIPPLHLVLVEEPEAHLHLQVQQVFLRKAYAVLRNHTSLGENPQLRTQMIVSTHSSHVAHEMDFASVRYFRRLQGAGPGGVPVSSVVNLSEVFGSDDQTAKFVTRYLRSTHCDLFFADAAILVEGPAERILIPHFIRRDFERLHYSYVSLLEIGGSHAHRLQPLIEHLGLATLIVTDLDASHKVKNRLESVAPQRKAGQKSRNTTLESWHPKKDTLDELIDLSDADKVKKAEDATWSLRVAYQVPVQVEMTVGNAAEALCTTFEDSLILENVALFRGLEGSGLIRVARDALAQSPDAAAFSAVLWQALQKKVDKSKFALEVLWHDKLTNDLKAPRYISDGLAWLQEQVRPPEMPGAPSGSTASGVATNASAPEASATGSSTSIATNSAPANTAPAAAAASLSADNEAPGTSDASDVFSTSATLPPAPSAAATPAIAATATSAQLAMPWSEDKA